jgi:hypothetical protein
MLTGSTNIGRSIDNQPYSENMEKFMAVLYSEK